jgi:glycine betaine/proline transport system ATP-binding protein
VLENAAYGLGVQGVSKKERTERALHWLDAVGLNGYAQQYPAQLSGGQQQRVGLARALCTDAQILLMDEAFSALDPLIRSEMQDQLIELQKRLHKTIIFITHDLDEALRLGDRIAILKDGEMVQQGPPDEILLHPATDYVEAFVKDVNRARALTVDTVMKPPSLRITAETIGLALQEMRNHPNDYAYCVNADGYQGLVKQETLEEAAARGADRKINDSHYEAHPHIAAGAVLESALPDTLSADYPLPVVDEQGNLQGELSRNCLAAVLGDNGSSDSKKP